MIKRLTLLTLCLLMGWSVASQPVGHIWAGQYAWKASGVFADQEWKQAKFLIQPAAAIGSHIVMDKAIGEASLGEWQIYIGIVRAFIGYIAADEKDKGDYLQYAFWSLSPDIAQKGLGWNWAHPEIGGDKIFNLNRDQNELAEELFLASVIFKWEYKF